MGARNDAERTVVRTTVVEVKTNGHQTVQYGRRRLDEQGPFLFRPALKLWMVDALSNWNAEILVDGNKPVHGGWLVEVGALNRDGASQKRTERLGAAERRGDRNTPSGVEKIACAGCIAEVSEVRFDGLALRFWQDAREHNEAVWF
jgi:hypothetical protein